VLYAAVGACQYHGDLVLTIQWCCRTMGFGRALKCILRRTLPITLYSTHFFDDTAAAAGVVAVVLAADSLCS
jgi:hypothetical protein